MSALREHECSSLRTALQALLQQACEQAPLEAEDEVAIVLAEGEVLALLIAEARAAIDGFERDLAITDSGRAIARTARAELSEPASAWVMFFARPLAWGDRARLVHIASMAAAIRIGAPAHGLAARTWCGTPLASARLVARAARECGDWFGNAELVTLLMLARVRARSLEAEERTAAEGGVPVLWMGDGARVAEGPGALAAPASAEIPPALRASAPARIALCEPTQYAAALHEALEAAGYEVESVDPRAIDMEGSLARFDLVIASVDKAESRALACGGVVAGIEGVVPVLATSAFGHDDARLLAARAGASAFVALPAGAHEIVRAVRDRIATKRLVDDACRRATDLREAQSELMRSERMATLGLLATSVGHDLRAPLASIRSNSELALRTLMRLEALVSAVPGAAKLLQRFAELERTNLLAADRLAEIVASLKEFAHAEGRAPRRAVLREVVDQVLALCAHELRHVHVICEIPEGLADVRAPRADAMQLVMNLIVNAAHAARPGGRIEVSAAEDPDGCIALWVWDDGPGIAPDLREMIFRAGFTTKTALGGTGLGLSIVKRVVDANEGRIDVESTPGRGTRFRVVLPRAEPGC